MQNVWSLFCCFGARTPSMIEQYDMVNTNNLNNNNNNNNNDILLNPILREPEQQRLGFSNTNAEEDEVVVGKIMEQIDGIEDPSQSAKVVFNLVPSTHLKVVILGYVLGLERTKRQPKSGVVDERVLEMLVVLMRRLDDVERREIFDIITGLPSAVLGDNIAKDATRVFIDLYSDVKESFKDDRLRVYPQRKLVETLSEMIQQFFSRLGERSDDRLALLGDLLETLGRAKVKLILQQLLSTRIIPHEAQKRLALMEILCSKDDVSTTTVTTD
eukprot:TRINITY_DN6350_c0_g1_i3.p1 TRINITY_DN6350_c0_g1~~TRINITY_DN6350_c0_g1_i3.p1  ORF type:complete len:272 (+),score=58.78 TRINITY_DN6350_c0_g1_i3:135-950(+)